MTAVLWAIILLLCSITVALCSKVYCMRKGARQLREGLQQRLSEETNTLLSLATRDKEMQRLADSLNQELKALRRDRLRYQQGDRDLKESITNISHDLRTPLTAVFGYLELLKRQQLSPDAARYLLQIQNRAEELKKLIEELFLYSVIRTNQECNLQPVELGRALEEALLSFYGIFESQGITPKINLPDQKVERYLDRTALNRVLGNILANSLKYSAGAFTVTLDSRGNFTFSNLAPGLSQVEVGKLFDRFYTVRSDKQSTGLGLSIAKLLTERMGGNISAVYEQETLQIIVKFPPIHSPLP